MQTAYRTVYQNRPRGRRREFVRYAASLAAATMDAYRVVAEETHGEGRVISVTAADSAQYPAYGREAVAA